MQLFLAVFLGMWALTLIQEGIEAYLGMHILGALRAWKDKSLPANEIAKRLAIECAQLNEKMNTLQRKKFIVRVAKMGRIWYVILPSLPWLAAAMLDFLFGQCLIAIFGGFLYLLVLSIPACFFSRLFHGELSITPVVFMVIFFVTAFTTLHVRPQIQILADATEHLGLPRQGEDVVFQKAQFLATEITWIRQVIIVEAAAISAVIGALLTVIWTHSPRLAGGRFPVAVRAQLWTILCLIGSAWNYAIIYFFLFQHVTKLSYQIRSFILR